MNHLIYIEFRVLNVAGPRASKEPEVAGFVITILDAALKP